MNNSKKYFYGQQFLDQSDYDAVSGVLHRRYISQGPSLDEFQSAVSEYCGADYCIAVANGTSGLQLACMAIDVKEGDIGWTTAMSFAATANAMRHAGLTVDFIDIESNTFNIDLNLLEEKLKEADKDNCLPKVVLPVHFAGVSCDMQRLRKLADRYDFRIIEDACQAMGGSYHNSKIGSCDYSDAAVFSLHPVKSITTGEGGLIVTNDNKLFENALLKRSHGMRIPNMEFDDHFGPWHREMVCDGNNFRITEFQCALGISQLKKLDSFIQKRRKLVGLYQDRLGNHDMLRLQHFPKNIDSAFHLMLIQLELEKLSKGKIKIFEELESFYIHLSVHYYPIPLHPFYRKFGYTEGMFPAAEDYYKRAFTLPLHIGLDEDDINFVCDRLIEVIEN
jgi:UDP-4-amino-4,6-dideoxy-N-acetyl-beta-L-altrosamine transaminase